jgi:hypothetical protein
MVVYGWLLNRSLITGLYEKEFFARKEMYFPQAEAFFKHNYHRLILICAITQRIYQNRGLTKNITWQKNDQLRMLGKFKFSRHQVVIQSDARIK